MELVIIHNLTNPDTGNSYKEDNLKLKHAYSVGDLVEIVFDGEDDEFAGMRLYVIGCVRDCDGTPLYVLGSKGMDLWQDAFVKPKTCYNFNSFSGFSEQCLMLIKAA